MKTSKMIHVEVFYDEGEECYIFSHGRGNLRLNQETARWVYSWLGRNLTPLALDAAMPPSAEPDSGLESVPAVESDTQPRK